MPNENRPAVRIFTNFLWLVTKGATKTLPRKNGGHCSDSKVANATVIPQPLGKSNKEHEEKNHQQKI